MEIISKILVGLIALIHLYILWFEMFAWERRGPKIFKRFSKDLFSKTKEMAANQGLYNGFLAAGLIWSLIINDEIWSKNISLFFLICIAIAGIYGALTAEKRIIFVQTIPAIITIFLIFIA